jgi:hypothetical protein
MVVAGEEESTARWLTLARATLLGGARCGAEVSGAERERNQEMTGQSRRCELGGNDKGARRSCCYCERRRVRQAK